MPDCSRLGKLSRGASRIPSLTVGAQPEIPRADRKLKPNPDGQGGDLRTILVCALLLTGCNVGPKYIKPVAPTAPSYKESAPTAFSQAPPGTWQPATPQDAGLKGKWWEMFNEPELNALEERLNIDNQNIKQYFENFMAARAQVREARAAYYPSLTANPSLTKTGTGGKSGNTSTNSGNGGSDYALPSKRSWAPDLWGPRPVTQSTNFSTRPK